jgi:hypothetical protein
VVPRGMRGERARLTNWEVQQILGCEEGDFSSRVTDLRNEGALEPAGRYVPAPDRSSQNSHRWVPPAQRISMAVMKDEKEL